MKATLQLALLSLIGGMSCAGDEASPAGQAMAGAEDAAVLIAIGADDQIWDDAPATIRETIEQGLGRPFNASVVLGPDEAFPSNEPAIRADSGTVVVCNAVLINGEPGEASCYRIDEYGDDTFVEVSGTILGNEASAEAKTSPDGEAASSFVMCFVFLIDGAIEHTSCSRFDTPG